MSQIDFLAERDVIAWILAVILGLMATAAVMGVLDMDDSRQQVPVEWRSDVEQESQGTG